MSWMDVCIMYACMPACQHTCMYACMHVCMYVLLYACSIYVHVHVCNLRMYVSLFVCMYVCMYACMHVCTYVCVYIPLQCALQAQENCSQKGCTRPSKQCMSECWHVVCHDRPVRVCVSEGGKERERVYRYMFILYVYTHTRTHTHAHIHAYTYTYRLPGLPNPNGMCFHEHQMRLSLYTPLNARSCTCGTWRNFWVSSTRVYPATYFSIACIFSDFFLCEREICVCARVFMKEQPHQEERKT